jgi:hypothetical protein
LEKCRRTSVTRWQPTLLHARFGEGRTEKGWQLHLAGRLFHFVHPGEQGMSAPRRVPELAFRLRGRETDWLPGPVLRWPCRCLRPPQELAVLFGVIVAPCSSLTPCPPRQRPRPSMGKQPGTRCGRAARVTMSPNRTGSAGDPGTRQGPRTTPPHRPAIFGGAGPQREFWYPTGCDFRRRWRVVEEPTQHRAAADPLRSGRRRGCGRQGDRERLPQALVRPTVVVVGQVLLEDDPQVRLVEDEQPVEALRADRADHPLGVALVFSQL